MSAAISVANSTLTLPGASSQSVSVSASDSYASAASGTNAWSSATVAGSLERDTISA